MKSEKRISPRKSIGYIPIKNLALLDPFTLICKRADIVDASATGFLLYVSRNDLVPKHLRSNLTIKPLEGERVILKIAPMELEMDGRIARTRFIGNGVFEIAVDFSDDAPEYWRECLIDLLPGESEEL